jgi:hypothetical protein
VNKSLLRKKIFKIKKKKFHKDFNINPDKFIDFLKIINLRSKILVDIIHQIMK